ncbi:MAG: trypsin-like peptidase domain-containing protein [Bacteriovoracaceae bacterium]|nr:trypsin-like peptidase domain-containing protein [Bacteriovoracaceae bacterium]
MKNFFTTQILLLIFSQTVYAKPTVIYGDDNRVEVVNSDNAMFRELAASTAAMIPPSAIKKMNSSSSSSGGWGGRRQPAPTPTPTETFVITGPSMIERGMCSSERFAEQTTAANCSGFLVGEDLLVTAGHCIESAEDCANYKWVFDYKIASDGDNMIKVGADDIYSCASIVERKLEGYGSAQNDFALIKLDRKVTGRRTLEYRRSGAPEVNDEIVVIGHPTGLPTKIADGAWIRSLSEMYFSANLDTYGGNSGSAVFNASTGIIEGILVRGARDYIHDQSQNCYVSNQVGDDYGTGEDVTFITNIEALK